MKICYIVVFALLINFLKGKLSKN